MSTGNGCSNCGGTSSGESCGTKVTTCNVVDILKCIADFPSREWKTQSFYLNSPTSTVTITAGTLPADISKIRVSWNGVRQAPGVLVGSGFTWSKSGNAIIMVNPTLPSGIGSAENPCMVDVDWEEVTTIEDYIKENCPDLADFIK